MFKQFIAATACAALLAGCSTMRSPVVAGDQKVKTGLLFIRASGKPNDRTEVLAKTIGALADNKKKAWGFDGEKEKQSVATCLGISPKDAEAQFAIPAAMVLGIVVEKGIGFVLDKVEEKIAKVIEEHTATYGAAANSSGFYKQGAKTTLNYSCFRFSRGKQNKLPTMDVVGQWRASPDGGALEVRVLRIFYREKVVKRGSKIGVSIGFKANATWQEGNKGKQGDAFDVPISSGKFNFDKEDQKFFIYPSYNEEGRLKSFEESATQLPLPSWSKPKPTTSTYGNVRISVNVAEVAKPPKYLKTMQSLFKENKDKMKGVLQSAANETLGIEQGDQKK